MSHSRKHSPSHPLAHTRAELEKILARGATESNRQLERRTIEVQTRAPARRETEIENLNKARGVGAITRERVKSPFTLPAEIHHRYESEAEARKHGGTPEPRIRQTALDEALDRHEADALAQYIKDRSAALSGRQMGHYAWDQTILNERQQEALQREAFVHKYLNRDDRKDLTEFTRMILPVDNVPAKTPEEFGAERSGSTDPRFLRGVFVGAVKKIAQRLCDLYRLFYLPHYIVMAESTRRTITLAQSA